MQERSDMLNIREILRILKKHAWLIMLTVVLAVGFTAAVVSLERPTYEARAALLVDQDNGDTSRDPNASAIENMLYFNRARSVETQVQLLRSADLISDALAKVENENWHPWNDLAIPRSALGTPEADRVFSITPVGDTDLISVAVRWSDPEKAATVANAIAQQYLDQNRKFSRSAAHAARKIVDQQLRILDRRLQVAGLALRDYKLRHRVVALDSQTDKDVGQLAALQADRETVQAELRSDQAQLSQTTDLLKKQYQYEFSATTFQVNPDVQLLQQKLADLERQRSGLLDEYTPTSDKVKALDAQIASVNDSLKHSAQTITGARQKTVNPVYDALRQQVANLSAQVMGKRARLTALSGALQGHQSKLLDLPDEQYQLAELQRNYDALQQQFQVVSQKAPELRIDEEAQLPNASVVDAARPNPIPIAPKKSLALALALVLGALVGSLLALVREFFRDTMDTTHQMQLALDLPVVGMLPNVKAPERRLLNRVDRDYPELEGYRFLATPLMLAAERARFKSLLLTSLGTGQGNSTTAVNLATVMAQRGKRVVLVDADLRRPSLHHLLGVEHAPGLTDVVAGNLSPIGALKATSVENLLVLPCGSGGMDPNYVLGSNRCKEVLRELEEFADIVIIDSPPCVTVSDASLLAPNAGATLLTAASGKAQRRAANRACTVLNSVGAETIGFVANKADVATSGYYYQDTKRTALPGPRVGSGAN